MFASLMVVGGQQNQALAGDPVYLQPGQCVMVGAQQVCAMKPDASATPAPNEVNYVCRYSEHKGGDLPGYKTYGLVKVTTRADGSSREILIKDFGIRGKEKCEQAAEDRKK
ncbi:hypothetical protein EBZ80_20500 [bacterium]|nr:hypothetical protein [bacterium]